jgi:hypothetical protein
VNITDKNKDTVNIAIASTKDMAISIKKPNTRNTKDDRIGLMISIQKGKKRKRC